ncbi:TIGR04149 family rSAM-modified RiPP [Algoriphagus yeomjeoni]|uniref:Natural product n=1 Tax=Algoriphagus yeomjeoni TaxID=291403 RepID=A0A327P6T9_9BACT|nr:natural product precursor [Algoriphagus yeomjeoni]
MKKLSLGKLNLLSDEVLERSQLAMIYGGSGGCSACGWSGYGNLPPICDLTMSDAKAHAEAWPGTYWCCDQCSTTSYCGS